MKGMRCLAALFAREAHGSRDEKLGAAFQRIELRQNEEKKGTLFMF